MTLSDSLEAPPRPRPAADPARSFRTSVVGSFPRPPELLNAFKSLPRGDPVLEERILDATGLVLSEEVQAGLDVVTDGEQSRNSFVSFLGQRIAGFEVSHVKDLKPDYKEILAELNTQMTYSRAVVVDKVQPVDFLTHDVERARSITLHPLKVTLPGPYLVMWECWHAEKSRQAYPDPVDFAYDVAKVIGEMAGKLASLGVEFIQIDEPMAGDLTEADEKPDRYHDVFTRIYGQKYRGFAAEKKLAFDLIQQVAHYVPKTTRLGMHMDRWPNPDAPHAGEGYERLLPELLMLDVELDQLILEYSNPICGSPSTFVREASKYGPFEFEIGLGCVNVRMEREEDLRVETPEEIVARVQPLAEVLPPEKVWLNPDCGFAPGMYREYPRFIAFEKLRSMTKAAEILRRQTV